MSGTCPQCSFLGLAAGNIDNDPSIDSWFVSDCDATSAGACPTLTGNDANAPESVPFNTYNDVNCP